MIRIFLYIVLVIVASALITALTNLAGFTVVELEGTRIDISTNLLIGLAVAALIVALFGGGLVTWLSGLPARMRRRSYERKRARGMTALTRGLEAVAAGDADDAQRHARQATKTLDEPALTRLLTAQAAQLAGDRETAQAAYTAMLEAPETEFLGLRGLYMHAIQSGDREEARAYAERAFRLRPGAVWAFESVLGLSLERGAWGDALEALTLARQYDVAEGLEYRRMEGALLAAQAYGASDSGDDDQAVKDAEAALKKAPSLTPAAALAAETELKAGRRAKAARILGDAWEAEPHPGLAAVMRRIFAHERPERLQGRLIKLAERKPDHPESRLLLAEVQFEGGDAKAAQETLEPLLTGRPGRRILELMAAITEARFGADAAKGWREKAAAAPVDVIPGANGVFHYTTEGWRRLVREYSEHERLAPPPLEVETPEIGAEEVRALLTPPEPPAPESAETPDEPSADGEAAAKVASIAAGETREAESAEDETPADDEAPVARTA